MEDSQSAYGKYGKDLKNKIGTMLPESHIPYTDKYFIRSKKILAEENINPVVVMQVFIRDGPGKIYGIDEAIQIIKRYAKGNVSVYGLSEGSYYDSNETIMHITGNIQDIIELETMYLGVITSATTKKNDNIDIDTDEIKKNAIQIRKLVPDKELIYFGARHWHYSMDAKISSACIDGGFDSCSTDIGAESSGLGHDKGIGTIPHALVIAFGSRYGKKDACLKATMAFDKHIEKYAKRIALIDTFNKEIDDSLSVAKNIKNLYGIRIDTAGELVGQRDCTKTHLIGTTIKKYWTGKGVTVELVRTIRECLDKNGFKDIKIVLSSGFGDIEKIKAFVDGERKYGRLFDSLGIGSIFSARYATADIVKVDGKEFSKAGRMFKANDRMIKML